MREAVPEVVDDVFEFGYVTVEMFIDAIKDFSPCKNLGCEKINSKLYIDSFKVLVDQYAHLFNLSISNGIFPLDWKLATVCPIPKEGDKTQMGNIRPMSLTHLVGKAMEKIVNKYLLQYLEDSCILSKQQFCFCKGCSTVDCISELLYFITDSLDKGMYTACTFLDYKKAFDSVDHSLLLKKLHNYGVSQLGLEWFTSYCNGRIQQVKCDGTFSSKLPISTGVPQGSILGPTLFTLYVNDVVNLPLNGQILLYADEIVLFNSNINLEALVECCSADLAKITNWSNFNKLVISAPKTKALCLGSPNLLKKVKEKPNRFLPCNQFLRNIRIKREDTCTFCPEVDTIEHFLFTCPIVTAFWKEVTSWFAREADVQLQVSPRAFLFGVPDSLPQAKVINFVMLFAKFFIYRQKLFHQGSSHLETHLLIWNSSTFYEN